MGKEVFEKAKEEDLGKDEVEELQRKGSGTIFIYFYEK